MNIKTANCKAIFWGFEDDKYVTIAITGAAAITLANSPLPYFSAT